MVLRGWIATRYLPSMYLLQVPVLAVIYFYMPMRRLSPCRIGTRQEPQLLLASNFKEMPQEQRSHVSALAVALAGCANMQRPGADRSHCLAASPATGAARF